MRELLNCGDCQFGSPNGSMCGVVASRTLKELVKMGYDTMSDTQTDSKIVGDMVTRNLVVRDAAEAECEMRLLQQESVRQGYGTVTY